MAVLNVRPNELKHTDRLCMRNIGSEDRIPLVVDRCNGVIWLKNDVTTRVSNQIGRALNNFALLWGKQG